MASKKHRTTKGKSERKVRQIIAATVIAVVLCVCIYQVYVLNQNPIRTVTAREETVRSTVHTTAFIVRDEQGINADFSGYTVPFVQDGERVASNAKIAAKFSDSGSAQRFAQTMELRADYERYAALASGTEYSSMKVEALIEKATDGVCDFLQATDAGNVAQAADFEADYLGKETALEIAVGESIDFSQKLADLSAKIQAQEASLSGYQTITTGINSAGYFFSETDGYEQTISYEDIESLTPAKLQAAMSAKPSASKGGKLIRNHVWYITAIVDARTADTLSSKKGKITISFPRSGVQDVQTTLHSIQTDAGGKCVAIFRCLETGEQLLRLRKEEIDIVLGEIKGFKVPSKAVRILEQDGNQLRGVYVLRGNIVSFRMLNSVYNGEDYVLSGNENGNYIKLYDEIITEGKDLYDGAVVYQ